MRRSSLENTQRKDDIRIVSDLVLGGPYYGLCSDVNAIRDPVPCGHCTCWFGAAVDEIMKTVDRIRGEQNATVKP